MTALAAAAPAAWTQNGPACAAEPDDQRRLACYDALFRVPTAAAPDSAPAPDALPALGEPDAATTAAPAGGMGSSSTMSRFWELDRADKRGTFRVKTYYPNFFLPLHYTSHINRAPSTPTQPPPAWNLRHRQVEAKLQLSLRAKVVQSLLLPNADLWFAFTQRSMWQLWNKPDSAPFRSTDYQPEAIYVVPIPARLGQLPFGWRWRMAEAGVAHQSNGQSDPLSRSWNRV